MKKVNKLEKKFTSGKLDINMPAGIMKVKNIKQAKLLATLRNVNVSEIRYRKNRKLVPVEVNLEERLKIANFKIWQKEK